ncbi:MAG: hypothetical protein ING71_19710 [Rhodocyclaceae bacterium]|nr:hypothetical protein [Rhodocyclaceae bacterium]
MKAFQVKKTFKFGLTMVHSKVGMHPDSAKRITKGQGAAAAPIDGAKTG